MLVVFRATKLQINLKVSERSKRKVRFLSISSLPVIFCSLTLAKTSVFSCKCNNCDAVVIRETERRNGKFSASTGSVQVLISLSRSVFSTAVHTKQNQSRLLIDVSGPVEASKGVSSCPRVGLIQWQLFLNMRIRELILNSRQMSWFYVTSPSLPSTRSWGRQTML